MAIDGQDVAITTARLGVFRLGLARLGAVIKSTNMESDGDYQHNEVVPASIPTHTEVVEP